MSETGELALVETHQKILAALRHYCPLPLNVTDLEEETGVGADTVKKRARELYLAGFIRKKELREPLYYLEELWTNDCPEETSDYPEWADNCPEDYEPNQTTDPDRTRRLFNRDGGEPGGLQDDCGIPAEPD